MDSQVQTQQQKYHTHISSNHKWFDLKLKEIWKYRDLVWLFTKRSFTVSYKQTVLGPAWLFISPIMSSLVYTFIFGNIAGMSTDGLPQILFYLSGHAIWHVFASSLTGNANTFRANAGVFGKVYFPRMTVPISNVLSNIIRFFIQFILVAAVLVFYTIKGDVSPNWAMFWVIPIVLIQLGMMGMGLGIIISSTTTKYRDLSVFVGFGVSLLMYATPVVYPLSQLTGGWTKAVISVNPITQPVELFRYALLGKGTFDPLYYGISWAVTVLVMTVGIMIFNKIERNFMDTV